jgi:hypothetical protein
MLMIFWLNLEKSPRGFRVGEFASKLKRVIEKAKDRRSSILVDLDPRITHNLSDQVFRERDFTENTWFMTILPSDRSRTDRESDSIQPNKPSNGRLPFMHRMT